MVMGGDGSMQRTLPCEGILPVVSYQIGCRSLALRCEEEGSFRMPLQLGCSLGRLLEECFSSKILNLGIDGCLGCLLEML